MMRGIFIAGTDTGVGKTLIAVALTRALIERGLRVAVLKPVATGAMLTPAGLRSDDALALMSASNIAAAYEAVNPYCLSLAVSPHLAARQAGVVIEPARLARGAQALAAISDFLVVEGAGGWLAPIGPRETMADVANALALPVLLVVGLRLGCLNHALLTQRAIGATHLQFAGWIANLIDPAMPYAAENVDTLTQRLGRAPLASLAWGALPAAPFEHAAHALVEGASL